MLSSWCCHCSRCLAWWHWLSRATQWGQNAEAEVCNLDAHWFVSHTGVQREDIMLKCLSGETLEALSVLCLVQAQLSCSILGSQQAGWCNHLGRCFLFLLILEESSAEIHEDLLQSDGWNLTLEVVSRRYFSLAGSKIIGKKNQNFHWWCVIALTWAVLWLKWVGAFL